MVSYAGAVARLPEQVAVLPADLPAELGKPVVTVAVSLVPEG